MFSKRNAGHSADGKTKANEMSLPLSQVPSSVSHNVSVVESLSGCRFLL